MKNKQIIYLFQIFLICIAAMLQAYAINDEEQKVIDIDSRLELFIDDFLIDSMSNCQLVMHHPIDEGPVLYFDRPWEGPFCGYCTVIKDEGSYKLYYRGLPKSGKDGSNDETTCYAESSDGIKWTKPSLNLFKVQGTKDNNVILADNAPFSHNFSPFLDQNPDANENQKYKALAGTKSTGLYGFVSPDGINWSKMSKNPVFTDGIFDSQNVAFWSKLEEEYVCYFRTWSGEGYKGKRTVSRTTSEDFVEWNKPEEMQFGDAPLEHLYTNQTHPYFRAPHIYIATAARFMPNRQVLSEEEAIALNVNPKYFKDCSDVVLITSRGGNTYDRTFMSSFIRPGIGLQNWVSRSNYPALNIVQTGPTEMSLYVNQDYAQPTAHLRRYSMRLDGFSSINANYDGGEFVTNKFTFSGNQLYLNFSTSAAGEITIEILDKNNAPIPGFTIEDCSPLIGNEIRKQVSWINRENLRSLNDKIICLRVVLKDANIYSFQFQ